MDQNPFAPPSARIGLDILSSDDPGPWTKEGWLVCRRANPFPDRCIFCNMPADGKRRSLELYTLGQVQSIFLIVLGCTMVGLPLVILYLIVRSIFSSRFDYGICSEHRANLRRHKMVASVMGFGSLAFVIFIIVLGKPLFAVLSRWPPLDGIVGAIVFFAFVATFCGFIVFFYEYPTVERYDEHFVWLKGSHRTFLEQLPLWPLK